MPNNAITATIAATRLEVLFNSPPQKILRCPKRALPFARPPSDSGHEAPRQHISATAIGKIGSAVPA
jgi:hypothetical protein